jgi:hypothetical protein
MGVVKVLEHALRRVAGGLLERSMNALNTYEKKSGLSTHGLLKSDEF